MSMKFVSKRIINNTDQWDFSALEKMNLQLSCGLLKKEKSTIPTTPLPCPSGEEKTLRPEKHRVLVSKSMESTFHRLTNKRSRDAYVEAELVNGIASQIRILRQQRGWSQKDLAEKINTSQGVISRLEDPSYGRFSLKSLLQLAAIFDVALIARFLPFSQAIPAIWDTRAESLEAESFEDDFKRICFYSKSDFSESAKYKNSINVADLERKDVDLGMVKSSWVGYFKKSDESKSKSGIQN